MDGKVVKPDLIVARLAGRQHGVVAISQLRAAGIGDDAVFGRVRAGRLHPVHHGVYAVGHAALPVRARWMAAVLACGRIAREGPPDPSVAADEADDLDLGVASGVLGFWGAAVSHRSAAELLGLLPQGDGPVDVCVPGLGGKKQRPGIRPHRSSTLSDGDLTLREGIPVTAPARTIADLRWATPRGRRYGGVAPGELRRAVRQASVLGLPLAEEDRPDRTRSDLEQDFLRLCRQYQLPQPEVNVRVGRHLVDFLWRRQRLVVETDGYRYHRGRAAFHDDRARDLDLRRRGWSVIRLSERQIGLEPRRVASALHDCLATSPSYGRESSQAA